MNKKALAMMTHLRLLADKASSSLFGITIDERIKVGLALGESEGVTDGDFVGLGNGEVCSF